jgi:hypothetical protein
VTDADSPYFGVVLPDLNQTVMVGNESFSGLFLRGGETSGILQADATAHNGLVVNDRYAGSKSGGESGVDATSGSGGTIEFHVSGDAETRPANMSVVWIIRIK